MEHSRGFCVLSCMAHFSRRDEVSMRRLRLDIVLLVTTAVACGGSQTSVDATDAAFEGASVAIDDAGRLVVDAPNARLRNATWYTVQPSAWPGDGTAPVVGTGVLRRDDDGALIAMPWLHIDRGGIEWLRISPVDALTPPSESKMLLALSSTPGATEVTLPLGTEVGMGVGDVFFALDVDRNFERLGDTMVALLEVHRVTAETATARVIHGDAVDADFALFAQPARRSPLLEARVLAALLEAENVGPAGLPVLASGVPELLGPYGISNVSFGGIHIAIDPADDDAIELATEGAPGGVFGAVVVGRVEGDGVVLNAGAWGPSIGRGGSVGILPGGLFVPGAADVVAQAYAPALVASVLAQRGEDARALYLLERELRDNDAIPAALRYHLREHLAMRYDAIGLTSEALALMTHDIDEARANNDERALINALSIRSFLDQQMDLPEAALTDARELLALSTGTLPEAALLGERLGYTRTLLGAGRRDEALVEYRSIRDDAERLGNEELALIATAELAQVQSATDDAAAALAIEELLSAGDALSASWRVSLLLSAAERRAAMSDRDGALRRLSEAFELLATLDGALERAYSLRRAAQLAAELGLLDEGVGLLTEAMRTYAEVGDAAGIATTAMELGSAQLSMALSTGGPDGLTMVTAAQESLMTAWALLTQSAQLGAAADVLGYLANLRGQMGDYESSDALFSRAARHAMLAGDYAATADIFQAAARIARDSGDVEGAITLRAMAESWANARGIELWLPPIAGRSSSP